MVAGSSRSNGAAVCIRAIELQHLALERPSFAPTSCLFNRDDGVLYAESISAANRGPSHDGPVTIVGFTLSQPNAGVMRNPLTLPLVMARRASASSPPSAKASCQSDTCAPLCRN